MSLFLLSPPVTTCHHPLVTAKFFKFQAFVNVSPLSPLYLYRRNNLVVTGDSGDRRL